MNDNYTIWQLSKYGNVLAEGCKVYTPEQLREQEEAKETEREELELINQVKEQY